MDLGELIVENERDYTGLAFELAGNEGKLAAIRAKLQANRLTTPLFDSEKFTRHLEKGFELAYAAYLEGRPPVDIVVQA
jgi:predicted O-linked N-acetylglucosamine transferase (SPINDLY family)